MSKFTVKKTVELEFEFDTGANPEFEFVDNPPFWKAEDEAEEQADGVIDRMLQHANQLEDGLVVRMLDDDELG
jgi:hypothetical protein